MTKDFTKKLRAFMKVVTDEAEANETFAKKIETALGFADAPKRILRQTKRREPAVLDPVKMMIDGDNTVEEKLNALEISQLKDIIAEYNLDSAHLSKNWRKKERLINLIMDSARQWATKGDAFRE